MIKLTEVKKLSFFRKKRRGVTLIIVILILTFLLTIGLMLITVTTTGKRVSANIRSQDQAFNAAEAGFDTGWIAVENSFADNAWTSFEGHYLTQPPGIDLPSSDNYFRRLTDNQILNLLDSDGDGTVDYDNVIFYRQPFSHDENGNFDSRFTYTVFLIDDEAGGLSTDPSDALMVCIGTAGTGEEMNTVRLEIELAVELQGSSQSD